MAATKLPEIGFVRECLDYDPETGVFTWRERPLRHFANARGWWQWNPKLAGKPAGSRHNGAYGKIYWCIRLAGHIWLAHRVAWLLVHGADPWPDEVDHIDGDPLNNRIANLRLATRSQQSANSRRQSRGTITGVKGVTPNGRSNGYDARITLDGKTHYIGHFSTIEEAAEARRKAAIQLYGEFHRHE
jgi:hypothetical protein